MTLEKEKKSYKWKDEFYVLAYRLAREGNSDNGIAKALGLTHEALRYQMKRRPALKEAIEEGRKPDAVKTFQDYVYKRLSPRLKWLWDKVNECEKKVNGVARIEALLEKAGLRARQHLFVHAFLRSNFNASEACRKVNISKKTFDSWRLRDPDFAELVDKELHWHKENFFEGALIKLVAEGHPSAVIFANRNINRHRGYDKDEDDGQVLHTHLHTVIDVDELDLPLETKKQILGGLRKKQLQLPPKDVTPQE